MGTPPTSRSVTGVGSLAHPPTTHTSHTRLTAISPQCHPWFSGHTTSRSVTGVGSLAHPPTTHTSHTRLTAISPQCHPWFSGHSVTGCNGGGLFGPPPNNTHKPHAPHSRSPCSSRGHGWLTEGSRRLKKKTTVHCTVHCGRAGGHCMHHEFMLCAVSAV